MTNYLVSSCSNCSSGGRIHNDFFQKKVFETNFSSTINRFFLIDDVFTVDTGRSWWRCKRRKKTTLTSVKKQMTTIWTRCYMQDDEVDNFVSPHMSIKAINHQHLTINPQSFFSFKLKLLFFCCFFLSKQFNQSALSVVGNPHIRKKDYFSLNLCFGVHTTTTLCDLSLNVGPN